VPDEILKQLAKNNGVVMVTFVPGFVSQPVADYNKRETDQQTALTAQLHGDTAAVATGMDAWHQLNPAPRASLIDVANHIDHIKAVAGIDHIGLGSDFDGITSVPIGLEDVSTYPALIAELLHRGYSDDDIRKITNHNILRVLRDVEATAATMGGKTAR
jgi:membrane dipeptidase